MTSNGSVSNSSAVNTVKQEEDERRSDSVTLGGVAPWTSAMVGMIHLSCAMKAGGIDIMSPRL